MLRLAGLTIWFARPRLATTRLLSMKEEGERQADTGQDEIPVLKFGHALLSVKSFPARPIAKTERTVELSSCPLRPSPAIYMTMKQA